MSFLNKYFWMPGKTGYTDGEMSYDNSSRTEPKRAQQWLMDSPEPELFCKKKQAVEAAKNRPMSGYANADISLWENSSQFQSGSGLFTDRLFGPELVRTSNHTGIKISSVVGAGNSNVVRMGFEDQVNANQIKYSGKGIPVSMGLSYCSGDNYTNLFSTTNGDNISSGPTCDYFVGSTFDKVNGSFTLMGQTINKGDGSMFMGHGHSREDSSILSTRQPSLNGNGNFVLADHQYVSGDDNIISRPPAYNKGHESLFAMGTSTAYNKANDNFISMGQNFDKGNDNIIPIGPTRDSREYNLIPLGPTPNRVNTSVVLMGTGYKKGQSYKMGENCTAISFGGSFTEANNRSLEHNADPNVTVVPAATLNTDANGKKKEKKKNKKNPANNFPTNVKRLLATGILDGVPVKYTSWARDKSLRGIIKEGAYNCGCNDCKFSQTLNAYEFERHAGCKTKHPNNHIYFQNGKSVYAVVLELQNTTKEMLFEAIQSVTGSPINQKNFSMWKASYEAATRELGRIYGKDGVVTRS